MSGKKLGFTEKEANQLGDAFIVKGASLGMKNNLIDLDQLYGAI